MTLSEVERGVLYHMARSSVAAALHGERYSPTEPESPALQEKRGCFVTLKTGGKLRGCLGCFTSEYPLYQTVSEYARYSALDDPRFSSNRLTPQDLDHIAIDISALTPLEICADPKGIILGVHGIYVKKGVRTGCFLPQVATETNWTVEEFWGHCCRDKAGLDWDAWKSADTVCMQFTAEVFGDE